MDDMEIRVTALERDLCNLKDLVLEERRRSNGSLEKIDRRLTELADTIQKYRDEARSIAAGKPTWAVTLMFSLLASICTGLAIWTLTH